MLFSTSYFLSNILVLRIFILSLTALHELTNVRDNFSAATIVIDTHQRFVWPNRASFLQALDASWSSGIVRRLSFATWDNITRRRDLNSEDIASLISQVSIQLLPRSKEPMLYCTFCFLWYYLRVHRGHFITTILNYCRSRYCCRRLFLFIV